MIALVILGLLCFHINREISCFSCLKSGIENGKIVRKVQPSKTETLPKNCRERNTSKLILQGHRHPDTKSRQRQHKKRKLQADITDEHRCKNPQQNFSKQNSATHQKLIHHDQVVFISRFKDSSTYGNQSM